MPALSPSQALQLAKTIADLYASATAELVDVVAAQTARGAAATTIRGKLAELVRLRAAAQKLVTQVQSAAPAEAVRLVEKAYLAGVARGEAGQVTASLIRTNEAAVRAYGLELSGRLNPLGVQMLRWADDVYRQVIADTAHLAVSGALTRAQAVAKALDRFAQAGVTTFVGVDGSRMRIEAYAEMATRTTVMRAYLAGDVNAILSSGRNLGIIAGSSGCPQCFPWVDQVISLDGTNPNYPSLADAMTSGLFHPNCTHSVDPYSEGGLIVPSAPPTAAEVEANQAAFKAEQRLRALQRAVAESKRRVAAARHAGDPAHLAAQRQLLADRMTRLKAASGGRRAA